MKGAGVVSHGLNQEYVLAGIHDTKKDRPHVIKGDTSSGITLIVRCDLTARTPQAAEAIKKRLGGGQVKSYCVDNSYVMIKQPKSPKPNTWKLELQVDIDTPTLPARTAEALLRGMMRGFAQELGSFLYDKSKQRQFQRQHEHNLFMLTIIQ